MTKKEIGTHANGLTLTSVLGRLRVSTRACRGVCAFLNFGLAKWIRPGHERNMDRMTWM